MLAIALALGLLLVLGAFLLGTALGDNDEQVRAATKRGYEEGFDKGRRRGYRATFASARRRAERQAAEVQATPTTPPASAGQPVPSSPETSTEPAPAPAPASEEASESSEVEPCVYGDAGLCTPEQNARENEAERICGGGGPEAEARPDLCGPG